MTETAPGATTLPAARSREKAGSSGLPHFFTDVRIRHDHLGGENIYPAGVEQAITELEAVGGAAVIGVPDDKWGEVPRAVILLQEGAQLSEEQLRTHLEGRLARYKIPKSVVFVDEMPRTAAGRPARADLRKLSSGQPAQS